MKLGRAGDVGSGRTSPADIAHRLGIGIFEQEDLRDGRGAIERTAELGPGIRLGRGQPGRLPADAALPSRRDGRYAVCAAQYRVEPGQHRPQATLLARHALGPRTDQHRRAGTLGIKGNRAVVDRREDRVGDVLRPMRNGGPAPRHHRSRPNFGGGDRALVAICDDPDRPTSSVRDHTIRDERCAVARRESPQRFGTMRRQISWLDRPFGPSLRCGPGRHRRGLGRRTDAVAH